MEFVTTSTANVFALSSQALVLSSHSHFTKAIQAEVWEDVEEADLHYSNFLQEYRIECLQIKYKQELERCVKVILLVELRSEGLRDDMHGGSTTVEVKDLKRVRSNITQLNGFSNEKMKHQQEQVLLPPLLFVDHEERLQELYDELCDGVVATTALAKQEEAALKVLNGLTIKIERVGEKKVALYPHETIYYERPFVRLHLYNQTGTTEVEPIQDTRGGARDKEIVKHISFMQDIRFKTEIDECIAKKHVVFFEFMHRDKKRGEDVTRCWACLEMDEIPAGGGAPLLLEWYSPPLDVSRSKFKLHTIKELYCNIVVVNEY